MTQSKICTTCKLEKPLSEFTSYKKTGRPRSSCKACHAEHERLRRRTLPKRKPGTCADCGDSLAGKGPQAQVCDGCAHRRRTQRGVGAPLRKHVDVDSIIPLVVQGYSVTEACRAIEISWTSVSRRRVSDANFHTRLEEAVETGRKVRLKPCGTLAAYERGCSCDQCTKIGREAKRQASRRSRERWRAAGVVPEHGVTGALNYGCKCDVCRQAANKGVREWQRQANDKSLDRASRHNSQWSGPELELAAREDLSASEVAERIGRTMWAVQTMRQRLRKEPSQQWLAGRRSKLH